MTQAHKQISLRTTDEKARTPHNIHISYLPLHLLTICTVYSRTTSSPFAGAIFSTTFLSRLVAHSKDTINVQQFLATRPKRKQLLQLQHWTGAFSITCTLGGGDLFGVHSFC